MSILVKQLSVEIDSIGADLWKKMKELGIEEL